MDIYKCSESPEFPDNAGLQQNGAPPYITVSTNRHFDEMFPNVCIETYVPTGWPAKSSSLSTLEDFLILNVNDEENWTSVSNILQVAQEKADTIRAFRQGTFNRNWMRFENRLHAGF